MGKDGHTSQCMHVQNHTYANESRSTDVRDVHQLLNLDFPYPVRKIACKIDLVSLY